MNEHDSERLAGLLEADGLVPAERLDDADVVVLNTCCIRENADNRLYGNLGHLKAVKQRRPDLQIAVGGCLAQKDQHLIQARAPWVDAVFGTHNVAHATDLLRRSAIEGPVMEILEAAQLKTIRASHRPFRSGGSWPTPPGSPSRSGVTTGALSASFRRCEAKRSAARSAG